MIVISDDEDVNEVKDRSKVKVKNRTKDIGIPNLSTEMEGNSKSEDDICVIQEVSHIKKKKNGIIIGTFHSHERNPLLRKRVKPDLCVVKCSMKKTFPSTFSQFRFKRRLFQLEQSIRLEERLNYMKLLETTMSGFISSELIRQSIFTPPSHVVKCRSIPQPIRINHVPVVDLTKDTDSDTIDVEQESQSSDDILELPRDSLDCEVVKIPDDLVVAESSQKHLFENIQKRATSPFSSDSDNYEEVIDLVDEDKVKAQKYSPTCEDNGGNSEVQMLQEMNLVDGKPEVIDVTEEVIKGATCSEIDRKHKEQDDFDEEDRSELPKLTDEMEVLVYSAFRSKSNDVLAEGFNLVISTKDMHTLKGGRWLNDEIINFYMCLLMERGELFNYPSVYCFNTFFYTKLAESGHSSLKRWTRKVDIFSYDLIIVPVHLKVHWCLACINFPEKQIEYYDSMGGKNDQCFRILVDYLRDEHEEKKGNSFNCSRWSYVNKKDIPEQLNGSDCGVFVCTYAEYICRLAKFCFSQRDMPYFRVKMAYEILTKRLLL